VITTPKQQPSTYSPTNAGAIAHRALAIVRLPFTHKYAAPLWLALRLYVAWIFFQMGMGKLQSGWLLSDPVGELLKLVANGTLPIPFAFYRGVAEMLIGAGVTPLISHSMPFLELAVALSLATGVLTPVAAVGAILLNVNFILSGIGQIGLDGPIILAELLMVLAFRVVGGIGFEPLAKRILNMVIDAVRPASRRQLAQVPQPAETRKR